MNSGKSISVENVSKCYRIGIRGKMHDNLCSALLSFLKSPWTNYRRYRSIYRFDDIMTDAGKVRALFPASPDVIWALKDVSFDVEQGEVLGIIGRNGAGKSTLLKVLSRITDPTAGRVAIRGRVSSLLEVGTGFHEELTGRENVYLNGTILGMKKKEVDRRFDEIVAFSGIEKFIDTPVKRYSSGMKVRLAFSVAAHLEPEVMIIDEVLAVGDADFQRKCLNKMQDVGQQGRTVLFVSHNMPAVNSLCTRAILLDEGEITHAGPTHQVVAAYLNSGSGTTAQRIWKDTARAPGGEVARLIAVRVQTLDGRVADSIDITQPFLVQMEYEVLKPGHILLPHFRFINEDSIPVFETLDMDPAWRRRPRPEGHYVSTVRVPGNLLAEGMLYVSCHLITLYPTIVQFSERQVIAFHVVDQMGGDSARGDWSGPLEGVVRPLLDWNTEYNRNGSNTMLQVETRG